MPPSDTNGRDLGPALGDLQARLADYRRRLDSCEEEKRNLERNLDAARTSRNPEAAEQGKLEGVDLRNLVTLYLFPIGFGAFALAFTVVAPPGIAARILAGFASMVSTIGFWRLAWETRYRGVNLGRLDWVAIGAFFVVSAFLGGVVLGWAAGRLVP